MGFDFVTAHCGTFKGGKHVTAAQCSAERDWIGFDFGASKVVKCVRILQARTDVNQCCDPAGVVAMDRWNGTDWALTTWRHEPQDDGSRPPVLVQAIFNKLGQCDASNNDIERRNRKQSEQCAIPLSSVTRTLGHPLCIKHRKCLEIGFEGMCCPLGGTSGTNFMSRCCCMYLDLLPIFVDEIPLAERGVTYNKMDLE